MSDFVFLVRLPVRQPVQRRRRNAEWMLDCWVSESEWDKNSGIVQTGEHCRALLGSLLYQIISKFSSYSAFQYSRCRDRDRSAGLSWFLFVDHDLEIQIKSHFWSEISAVMQLTISTNHKICLLLNRLNFISLEKWRIFSVGKSFVFWDFYERFKKLRGNPRLVLG